MQAKARQARVFSVLVVLELVGVALTESVLYVGWGQTDSVPTDRHISEVLEVQLREVLQLVNSKPSPLTVPGVQVVHLHPGLDDVCLLRSLFH